MPNETMKYDPFDYYKDTLRAECNKIASEYIEDKIKESKIDVEANKKIAHKIDKASLELDLKRKYVKQYEGYRNWVIFADVISFIIGVIGLCLWIAKGTKVLYILLTIFGFLLAIIFLLIITLYLNKVIKETGKGTMGLVIAKSVREGEAKRQLAPLINSLNFRDFYTIVSKTTSVFKLDDELDSTKMKTLEELYQFNSKHDTNESIVDVMSGDIGDNPFIRFRLARCYMAPKTYYGYRTVFWTETRYDSEGNITTTTESQTLTASIKADAPVFVRNAYLVYGNEAAPDLSFHRYPSGINNTFSDNDVQKIVTKRTKKLEKITDKAVETGHSFQAMANTEFEALFGATNRDHEVQFRLLFTPLAQQNMVELIKGTRPWGDDFSFVKKKKLNIISSTHAESNFTFESSYFSKKYSVDSIKTNFIVYISRLFASLYFDLAPILAIPLYHTTEVGKYEVKKFQQRITDYEAESLLNHMDKKLFAHPLTTTDVIYNVKWKERRKGGIEIFTVITRSLQAIPQVEYVPVLCQDGNLYDVKVEYFTYKPLVFESQIVIYKLKKKDKEPKENINKGPFGRNKNYIGMYLPKEHVFTDEDQLKFVNYVNNNYNYY